MKKIYFLILAPLILFLFIIPRQEYNLTNTSNDEYQNSNILIDVTNLSNNNLAKKSQVSVLDAFSMIPEEFKVKLNENWTLTICDDLDIRTSQNSKIILGHIDFKNKNIYIDCRYTDISDTILHELGHVMQDELDDPELSSEFKKIYNQEKDKFLKAYPKTHKENIECITEYYAEACIGYFRTPNVLKNNCPETYSFLDKCVSKFCN